MATATAAFLRHLFERISSQSWSTSFADALDDELVFTATGTSPVAGRYVGKRAYLEQILGRLHDRLQSWPRPVIDNMIVDGDQACIQFHGEGGIGHNGADFNMQYCWILKVRDNKIMEITGYYDAAKMIALFAD